MPKPTEPAFSETDLAAIAKVLESAATHAELGSLIRDVRIVRAGKRRGAVEIEADL